MDKRVLKLNRAITLQVKLTFSVLINEHHKKQSQLHLQRYVRLGRSVADGHNAQELKVR